MTETFYAYYYGLNWVDDYHLSAPLVGTGTWLGCYTTDGVSSQCVTSGQYIVVDDAAKRPPKVHRSTRDLMKAYMRERHTK